MFGVVFRTWNLASWSLKRSRHASSIYITGQVFQFSTGLHYQWRKLAGTPKCVFIAHETALLDVGVCVRWSETGMSTRLWTIQYIMVTRAFVRKNTGTGTAIHFLSCHRCVWFPCHTSEYLMMSHFFIAAGAQRKLYRKKPQILAFFAAWWTCWDHDVCLWRDTPVYLAVSASVRVWPLVV